MTEQEYIDATNLANAMGAWSILRRYLDTQKDHDKYASEASRALMGLVAALEAIVKTSEK